LTRRILKILEGLASSLKLMLALWLVQTDCYADAIHLMEQAKSSDASRFLLKLWSKSSAISKLIDLKSLSERFCQSNKYRTGKGRETFNHL